MKRIGLLIFLCVSYNCLFAQVLNDDAAAYQAYEQGEYEKAALLLGKLFEKNSSDNYFDLYLSTLLKTRKYPEAEKLAKKMIKQQPDHLGYQISLGKVYQESGQQDKALKTFAEVISLLPKEENKIRFYVSYFYRFQAYDLAISAFLQGRKILGNEQLFAPELLNLYRFKKDKDGLVNEYINALSVSPAMLPQAEADLASLFDGNGDYLILQTILLKKLQKEPDNDTFTQLLTWQYIQRREFDMALRQLVAQNKRLKQNDAAIFNLANTFLSNDAYPSAIKAYEYLLAKGPQNEYYLPSKIQLIDTKYQLLLQGAYEKTAIAELADQYQALIKEFGSSTQTLFAMTRWANLQAYYLNAPSKAEEALENALKVPNLNPMEAGRIKLSLGDIYILNNEPWEAFLIYEQVAKKFENQDIGNEARFRSAKLSFYQGNFAYAKAQADVLKASTSQLIANDALNLSLLLSDNLQSPADSSALKMYADAEMLQFRNLPEKALAKLDSINISFPGNSLSDDVQMSKANIYIKKHNYALAAPVLQNLISQHPESLWADDALFILAGLYQDQLAQPEEAKKLFQKLISDFPGSMYTIEARKFYRKLRGDNMPL
ncbi:tetratricopeptide repeat protein [Pedobacter sp.]|jgi:tetratricopeptide (TPR) repeat protein|uniref:tetratricopeptide repeat protein n=1 Tax=Pedobacter sp. TaxID=1411316 RepID=UPI002C71992A|nr:tetratricopeptide repeat protein [Pedobacter sp.]HWW39944.1 tetratricopeptide repeat protein [Pedobacter sp.]